MKRLFLVAFVITSHLGCGKTATDAEIPSESQKRAKNVILFVADGAGLPTIHAASIYGYGKPQKLYVQNMPHIGLSETSSASNWVTDSAAGMTAIATGQKTHNGVISQSATVERGIRDGEPLKSILEYAEEHGLSTGVVSNSVISSATPAVCYAHSNDRNRHGENFSQILHPRFGDGVDVVIGRGRNRIVRETAALETDLAAALASEGYLFLDQPANLGDLDPRTRRLVALFETEESYEFDLEEATKCALDILSRNPIGFFLMVESDTHLKDIRKCLENMVELDRVMRETAERMHGTDTLLIFTSDHSYDLHFPQGGVIGEDIVSSLKADGHHNAEEVLVAAEGPGAEKVRGFFPNTHLFHVMLSAYGWE